MSAPIIPVSSPPRSDISASFLKIAPSIFRARSVTESSHSNGNPGLSSNSRVPPDKIALRVEDSPPIESPTGDVLSVPPTISSSEFTVAWRESVSHANIHALHLPPGADMSSLPIPAFSSSSASHLSGATEFKLLLQDLNFLELNRALLFLKL
ncbi:hypothetical protein OROGR_009376 [Orobanche gracilis]